MGYTTEFKGTLKFAREITGEQLAHLSKILGVDFREVKELRDKEIDTIQHSVDLEITKDYTGLQWDGTEKSYAMEKQVNFVIAWMKEKYPDFELTGHMNAQGQDVDDRWQLDIQDGKAVVVKTPPEGKKIQCPHCGGYFYINIQGKDY